jgi:hypothetical protein
MITDNERRYALAYAKQHAIWERKLMPIFYRAIYECVKPVLSTFNPHDARTDVWQTAYKKAYKLIGVSAARNEYLYLKRNNTKADIISFLNDLFAQRMSAYGALVGFDFQTDLTATTQDQIRKALEEAGRTFATNSQTARLIRQYTLGDIGKARALLIARTETTTASNLAKIEGAKEYFSEVGETTGYKMWITRMDGKERHDHMVINETAVPFNSVFDVGGFDGNVPGDPKLPGKERIRCRCTFVTLTAAGYRRRFGGGWG